MADSGFPIVGRRIRRGDADSRGGYVSKNLYVEMKESGPFGGCARHASLHPPMPCAIIVNSVMVKPEISGVINLLNFS